MSENAGRTILECPVCFETYGEEVNIPMIGTCGHSICSNCFDRNLARSCPICRKSLSFLEKHKNYTTIELLSEIADLKKTAKTKAISPEDGCLHCGYVLSDAEALVCKQCVNVNDENEQAVLTAMKKARICGDCGRAAGQHGHELTKYSDILLDLSAKLLDKEIKSTFPESAMDSMMKEMDDKMTRVKRSYSVLKERINNVSCTRQQLQRLGIEEGRRIAAESKNCVRNATTAYNEGKTALDGVSTALLAAADLIDKLKAPVTQETRPESAAQNRVPVVVPPSATEASRPFLPGLRLSTAIPRAMTTRPGTSLGRSRASLMPATQPSSSRASAVPESSRFSQRFRTRIPSAVSANN